MSKWCEAHSLTMPMCTQFSLTWNMRFLKSVDNWSVGLYTKLLLISFLENSAFRVRIGSHLSSTHLHENGIPHSSSLGVVLFMLAINELASIILPSSISLSESKMSRRCRSAHTQCLRNTICCEWRRLSEVSQDGNFGNHVQIKKHERVHAPQFFAIHLYY